MNLLNLGNTIEEIIQGVTELGIKVKEYKEEGLYVFNYSQIDSPKTHPVVVECRGTILDKDLNVVCKPFNRFFNLGEALDVVPDIDYSNILVPEKADGSLIKVYYWDGQWRIATRGTAFAETSNNYDKNFLELCLEGFGCDSLEEFSNKADNSDMEVGYTYLFELCSPFNRVLTPYTETTLKYLGFVSNETLMEYNPTIPVDFGSLCVDSLDVFSFNNKDEVVAYADSLPDLQEGFVIWDMTNNTKVKVKSKLYVQVHHIRGELGLTPKRCINLVATNEVDEYLTYFKEDTIILEPYVEKYNRMLEDITYVFNTNKDEVDVKSFALKVKDSSFSHLLFKAYRTGTCPIEELHKLDTKGRYKTFESYLEGLK